MSVQLRLSALTGHCMRCRRSDTDIRLQEVRTSVASQHVPIFSRLMDKDSHWRRDNGLLSLIPSVLLYGILGYPFVLPDMIGGNAYNSIFIHRQARFVGGLGGGQLTAKFRADGKLSSCRKIMVQKVQN